MVNQVQPDLRDEREQGDADWLDGFRHTCEIGSDAWKKNDIRPRTWENLLADLKYFYRKALDATNVKSIDGAIWKLTKGGHGSYPRELTAYFTNTISTYEAFERVLNGTRMSDTARTAVRYRFGTDMTWYQIAERVDRRADYCRREYKPKMDTVVYNTGVFIFEEGRLDLTDLTFPPSQSIATDTQVLGESERREGKR